MYGLSNGEINHKMWNKVQYHTLVKLKNSSYLAKSANSETPDRQALVHIYGKALYK